MGMGSGEAAQAVPVSLVREAQAAGAPGDGIRATLEAALKFAGVEVENWMELAQDRIRWKQVVAGIWDVEQEIEVPEVLERRAGVS